MIYLILSYLIGAIPTGYLIARVRGIADIRKHGSGNIGATNVARFLGVRYFFLIFILDAFKAYACLYMLAHMITYHELLIEAGVLLIGNGYSLFLQGSGGKGVATSAGILVALYPQLMSILLLSWIAVLFVTRTVGIASAITLAIAPLAAWHLIPDSAGMLFIAFMAAWGLWMHRKNIAFFLGGIKVV